MWDEFALKKEKAAAEVCIPAVEKVNSLPLLRSDPQRQAHLLTEDLRGETSERGRRTLISSLHYLLLFQSKLYLTVLPPSISYRIFLSYASVLLSLIQYRK